MSSLIIKFDSVKEYHESLSLQIKNLEKKIEDYSKKLGEMLRTDKDLSQEDPDVQKIKEQIEGNKASKETKGTSSKESKSTAKKKKNRVSKQKNAKWFDINGLFIYNGGSATGELEIYFKAVESLKDELQNLQRVKESLMNLIEKGLKEDLGCTVLQNNGSSPEIVLLKSNKKSEKFAYKSLICVNCEPQKITINGLLA